MLLHPAVSIFPPSHGNTSNVQVIFIHVYLWCRETEVIVLVCLQQTQRLDLHDLLALVHLLSV